MQRDGWASTGGTLFTHLPWENIQPHIPYLISNEELILDGKSSWICGAEPPGWPKDGVPRAEPFRAVFDEQWHNEVLVLPDAATGEVQDLQHEGEKRNL